MLIIFAQGRTGSSLLADLLESTGYVTNYNEVLEYPRFIGLLRFWRRPLLKIKIYQIRKYLSLRSVKKLFEILSFFGVQFITIERDINDQILSWYIAQERGTYHKFDDSKEKLHITIVHDDFKKRKYRKEIWRCEEREIMKDISHVSLSYEKHLQEADQHQHTVDLILKELGYAKKTCSTKYKRIRDKNEITIKMHRT